MRGLAEGAGIPIETLRRAYMIPVVSDYSCSGAALWGKATADGHLYQFRNLDYIMDGGLQNFPAIVVMLPDDGIAHVNITFAGFLGVNTGMNAEGTVLTEMGDSPAKDYPYDLDGVPFFVLMSDLLHDAHSLDEALDIVRGAKRIKKYHYIIANGKDLAGVKIKAHAPELVIWKENDPKDEVAPRVFENIVYNAESRDPLAVRHIKENYGKYDAARSDRTDPSRSDQRQQPPGGGLRRDGAAVLGRLRQRRGRGVQAAVHRGESHGLSHVPAGPARRGGEGGRRGAVRARKINGAYSQIGTARRQIRPNENSTMAQVIAHYVNPVLSALKRLGGSGQPAEVCAAVAADLGLEGSPIVQETMKSGQTKFYNTIAWVRLYLAMAGYIDRSRRGVWTLTEKGRDCPTLSDAEIRELLLEIQRQGKKSIDSDSPVVVEEEDPTDAVPDESEYKSQLLDIIRGLPPNGFERLSQRLLRESGFDA